MPNVRPKESRESFIRRCIPYLIREGKSQDEAIAICGSMYDQSQRAKQKEGSALLINDAPFDTVLSI